MIQDSLTKILEKANSPKEVLDLVDENDVVIGTIVRKVANQDPKFIHREVGVLLLDKENRVLIQKRSQYKKVFPNMWSIVAGHIPAGGDPEKTAYLELKEELGIEGIKLDFLVKKYIECATEAHFMYYYLGLYSGQEVSFDQAEVSATKLVSYEELKQLMASGEKFNKVHLDVLLDEVWSSTDSRN